MFEEDDIVIYNGQYRVVEKVSTTSVHFKDYNKETLFSFAPISLVRKISTEDSFTDFLDNQSYDSEFCQIFGKAIAKYLKKNINL